jgi:hypothetical protein
MKAHKSNVDVITAHLAKVAERTEVILSGPVDDEEEDIQISPPASVVNIKKRLLVVEDSAARDTPPSDLSQPKQFRDLDQEKFALNRPPNPTTLPLALLHPIFAEFVTNVEDHEPTPEDNALVRELRQVMSKPWDEELKQSGEFRQILEKHYDIQIYPAEVANTKRATDGHAAVGDYMYVVFEMKTWNGKGDPEVQASLYSLEAFRAPIRGKKDPLDLLPCIIVYCIGGCLSLACYPLLTPHRLLSRVCWDGPYRPLSARVPYRVLPSSYECLRGDPGYPTGSCIWRI